MKEALYYIKTDTDNIVQCLLCPNLCKIYDGMYGSCRSRKNVSGVLIATNYNRTVAFNLDPIEKKPLYHYYPGSQIVSIGANSCNLHCSFCQNYEISQKDVQTKVLSPEELLDILIREGQKRVAFTYTEPFTWFEYILDCGKLFSKYEIRIVLVTNGYINHEPLEELLPYIDAMNIDLKSMDESFYTNICAGKLQPVLDTIIASADNCHIEITNLLIPGHNDSTESVSKLVDFVASINNDIPLHFSRYFPRWKMTLPETPLESLLSAYTIAKQKLRYVYIGNTQPEGYSDTRCPVCNNVLISRRNFYNPNSNLRNGRCNNCGNVIYGRFESI